MLLLKRVVLKTGINETTTAVGTNYLLGRGAKLSWAHLAARIEALDESDLPKYCDLLKAVRSPTVLPSAAASTKLPTAGEAK